MKTNTTKTSEKSQSSSPFFRSGNSGGFLSVQAKLNVSEPGDPFEMEAEQMASQVVGQSSAENSGFFSAPMQVQPLAENVTPLSPSAEEDEKMLMPFSEDQPNPLFSGAEQHIRSELGGGTSLDEPTRRAMEKSFGTDLGQVKIHTDQAAAQINQQLGAHAFTTGNDIFFNSGKFNPETKAGKHLLAHELTHTIQQGKTTVGQTQVQRWSPFLTPEEELAQDKAEFRSRNYGPMTYTQGAVIGSGFEASYLPASNSLNITVRGKIRFADTLTGSTGAYSSPNHFMNQAGFPAIMNNLPPEVQAQILPYFQWTDEQKQIHMMRFRANLAAATSLWQDTGMSFQVNETGWEDVTATPHITLDITEGDAVHNTQAGGPFGLFTVTNESTSDHLQIEIVKQPTANDVAAITQIITNHNAATGASVNSGMIQGVRSYLGNDPGARGSAPQGFNNFMSLESDRSDDPNSQFYFTSVNFANNESTISEGEMANLDAFFSDPNILLDNADRGVEIDLTGYASAPGTSDYNSSLVESRLTSVQNYVDAKMDSSNLNTNVSTTTRTNDSDTSAEEDLANNPATHDPADYRRVDILITRPGRGGQNVFAHELGHVFGLGDEYAEVGSGYNRPTGTAASHDQLARDAGVSGGALVADDDRMMSTGNVVGAAHYSTFADALNQLTSKSWRIVTS